MRRFGEQRNYKHGERLFETGKPGPGMFVVLSGHVAITQRDGLGHVTPIIDQGPGQFLAEIGQLSGRVALVDGHAEGDVETLLISPERLRALLVAEADLGERIMRALILRRVNLIRGGAGGPVLIGPSNSARRRFVCRDFSPATAIRIICSIRSPITDAAELIARYSPSPADWPLVVAADGTVLRNPRESELARAMGMIRESPRTRSTMSPSSAAAPPGCRPRSMPPPRGLRWRCATRGRSADKPAPARASRITLAFRPEFPGMALTARAFNQAQKFGAEMMIPVEVKSLDCSRDDGAFGLKLDDGDVLRARSVVVASGARYRRPEIENLADFEGRGVWYWASPIEARLCAEQEVVLVGGGNSAGQAAVFLSGHARKVHMVIRGGGLGASMSRYLIERIEAAPNIELMFNTEVVALEGTEDGSLERVRWRSRSVRRRQHLRHPQSVPVRRRRSRHRLARRLRRHGRPRRLRGDRRAGARRAKGGWCRRWKPRCPACSPSAMFARDRSSGSAARSARARRWLRRCTAFSAIPQNRRFERDPEKWKPAFPRDRRNAFAGK